MLPLTTELEADQYLELVRRLPAFVTAIEMRARGQAERGIAVSMANLPNVILTLALAGHAGRREHALA